MSFEEQIRSRCFCLNDEKRFVKRILMPIKTRIPHDAGGVTGISGLGFDQRVIHHGYPLRFLADYTNFQPDKHAGFRRHFKEGPSAGYSTIRMPKGEPDEEAEVRTFFEPYGFRHGMQTLFFDHGGGLAGVAKIAKRSEPGFTDEEKHVWHSMAPYVFYAFRKYRWLLDSGFFTSHPDRVLLGIILADGRGRVRWLNGLARDMLAGVHGAVPSLLPDALEEPFTSVKRMVEGETPGSPIFRDMEYMSPYGRVVALIMDEGSRQYLPDAGTGVVLFIKPRPENRIDMLAKREREILVCVLRGMSDKSIAAHLYLSDRTIQAHMRNIFKKLRVSNRTEAALMAVRSGLAG